MSKATPLDQKPPLPNWAMGAAGLLFLATFYLIFVWAPEERTMGVVQRIFYIHLPSAFTAFICFYVGGVASIRYLRSKNNKFDDLAVAANEVGLLFTCVFLGTGMLWAKPIWGNYWAWDARLTTSLLLAIIYVAYFLLRSSVDEPSQRAAISAVVTIFGMVDIPIIYMANRIWRTQHPQPVIFGGDQSGLASQMWMVLLFTFFTFLVLAWCYIRYRRRLEAMNREVEALRRTVHAL